MTALKSFAPLAIALETLLAEQDRLRFVFAPGQPDPGADGDRRYAERALRLGCEPAKIGLYLRQTQFPEHAAGIDYAAAVKRVDRDIMAQEQGLTDRYLHLYKQRRLLQGAADDTDLARGLHTQRQIVTGLLNGYRLNQLVALRHKIAAEKAWVRQLREQAVWQAARRETTSGPKNKLVAVVRTGLQQVFTRLLPLP